MGVIRKSVFIAVLGVLASACGGSSSEALDAEESRTIEFEEPSETIDYEEALPESESAKSIQQSFNDLPDASKTDLFEYFTPIEPDTTEVTITESANTIFSEFTPATNQEPINQLPVNSTTKITTKTVATLKTTTTKRTTTTKKPTTTTRPRPTTTKDPVFEKFYKDPENRVWFDCTSQYKNAKRCEESKWNLYMIQIGRENALDFNQWCRANPAHCKG